MPSPQRRYMLTGDEFDYACELHRLIRHELKAAHAAATTRQYTALGNALHGYRRYKAKLGAITWLVPFTFDMM